MKAQSRRKHCVHNIQSKISCSIHPSLPAINQHARASQRDPLILHAHYRPRQAGRPKTVA
ncbi:hypothetical protein FS795_24665 [Agrobacterium vitis]|nr:hypothetical protein [Allorhizobium ampelinum]